ncbi:hypothetical protein [Streptomyces sp. YIM 98790]|uniref:hypothetical protein n=1 Tax=Streptomyces sp. YIM 98790 TaxID=2689077 RepID=UPI00140A9DBA|nr:hypothetical protein [Streptomyces sp. YIM 98790]
MPANPKKALITAAATALLLTGTAACGSDGGALDGLAAEEVAEKAQESMKNLDSLTMKGEITQEEGLMKLDVSLTTDGECSGTVAIDDQEMEFIQVGDYSYMKASDAFWDAQGADGAAMNDLVAGRWMRTSGDSGFGDICALEDLLDSMNDDSGDEKMEVTDGGKVNGRSTVKLTVTEDDETTDVYVANSDDAYIVRVMQEGGDEPGQIDLGDFNKKFTFSAPAEDDYVDMDSLSQQ